MAYGIPIRTDAYAPLPWLGDRSAASSTEVGDEIEAGGTESAAETVVDDNLHHPDFADEQELRLASLNLPKVDNHIHGGAFPKAADAAQHALAAAKRAGQKIRCHETGEVFDSAEQLTELYRSIPEKPSLNEYLRRYHITRDWAATSLADIEAWYYNGARAAIAAGCVGVDVRTAIRSGPLGDTAGMSMMGQAKFTPEEEVEAIVRGLEAAKRESGRPFVYSLTMALRRDQKTPEKIQRNVEIVRQAHRLRVYLQNRFGRDILRAIDYMGVERNNPLKFQAEPNAEARRLGFLSTAHASESWGEAGIRQGVNNLHVNRVGHATSLFPYVTPELEPELRIYKGPHDKNAALRLLAEEIPVETCLTSNIWTQAVLTRGYQRDGSQLQADLAEMTHARQYPHERFMALGGMNLISTDGIYTLGDTDLAQEYALGARAFSWGLSEMVILALASIENSFFTDDDKQYLIDESWAPFAAVIFGTENHEDTLVAAHAAEKAWRERLQRKHDVRPEVLEWIDDHRAIAHARRAGFRGDVIVTDMPSLIPPVRP